MKKKKPKPRRKTGVWTLSPKARRALEAEWQCRVTTREILLSDATPAREKLSAECRRLMAKIAEKRGDYQRYRESDQPAFARWMAGTFGALQTELRELHDELLRTEDLIREVEEHAYFAGCSHRVAYRRIRAEREQEEAEERASQERASRREERGEEPAEKEAPDFEKMSSPEAFARFLRQATGLHPDDLPKFLREKFYRQFVEDVAAFCGRAPEPEAGGHREEARGPWEEAPRGGRRRRRPPPEPEIDGPEKPEEPSGGGLKELYRKLVRRLHPDLRADGDASVGALWHEVQVAYAAGDVGRLETLLALTDAERGEFDPSTRLWEIKEVAKELRRNLRGLEKSLREARRATDWEFSLRGDLGVFERIMRRQFNEEKKSLAGQLEKHRATIARWEQSAPAKTRAPRKKKEPAGNPPGPSPEQPEFW